MQANNELKNLRVLVLKHFPEAKFVSSALTREGESKNGSCMRGLIAIGSSVEELSLQLPKMRLAPDGCGISQKLIAFSISEEKEQILLDMTCQGDELPRSKL